MKKIAKHILLFLLILATIISTASVFAGCTKKKVTDDPVPDTNEGNEDRLSYLPDEKFNAVFSRLMKDISSGDNCFLWFRK